MTQLYKWVFSRFVSDNVNVNDCHLEFFGALFKIPPALTNHMMSVDVT